MSEAYVVSSTLELKKPPPPVIKVKGLHKFIPDDPRVLITLVIDAGTDFTNDDIIDAVHRYLAARQRAPSPLL